MDTLKKDSIIISGTGIHLEQAYRKALELFSLGEINIVSDIIGTGISGTYSFLINLSKNSSNSSMFEYIKDKYLEMINYLSNSECLFIDNLKNAIIEENKNIIK